LLLRYRDFVNHKKASGRWNEATYEVNLTRFDRYCLKCYPKATDLSQGMVSGWCRKRETETNNSCRTRIYVVVNFIRYLRERGKTEVEEPTLPRRDRQTYIPHAFSEDELNNFFTACDSIESTATIEQRSRKITVPVFFRLLYSSGIRTNEVLSVFG